MSEYTKGPWRWFGSDAYLYLATEHSGRKYVMDCARMGMQNGQPRFQVEGLMIDASDLVTLAVDPTGEVRGFEQAKADPAIYRYDITGIDHPDARLIAAAPRLAEALKDMIHESEWLLMMLNKERDYTGQEHEVETERIERARAALREAGIEDA